MASEAVHNKAQLEALAFAISIKIKFVSSVFKDATVRRCNKVFEMGSTKSSRLIKNGLKYGYLERQGKDIIAKKVRVAGRFHNKLIFNPDVNYSISMIIDKIRETVLLNQLRKQTYVVDKIKKARSPENLKEHKARYKGSFMRNLSVNEGFSIKRIMEVTNTKKYRARKIVRSLVNQNQVKMTIRFANTSINSKGFDYRLANENPIGKNMFLKVIAVPCKNGMSNVVVQQLANSYRYMSESIKFLHV